MYESCRYRKYSLCYLWMFCHLLGYRVFCERKNEKNNKLCKVTSLSCKPFMRGFIRSEEELKSKENIVNIIYVYTFKSRRKGHSGPKLTMATGNRMCLKSYFVSSKKQIHQKDYKAQGDETLPEYAPSFEHFKDHHFYFLLSLAFNFNRHKPQDLSLISKDHLRTSNFTYKARVVFPPYTALYLYWISPTILTQSQSPKALLQFFTVSFPFCCLVCFSIISKINLSFIWYLF